jgi:hypothetical protein
MISRAHQDKTGSTGERLSDNYVNLDGLIPREDFEAKPDQVSAANLPATQTITELEKWKFFYSVLKKPDFQRETANWEPETVAELIRSFVNDDLVPAIILWRSPSNDVFVIDGSHRLSSLVAWVQDDYGDGATSRDFFEHSIPTAQMEAAEKTRKIVNKEVGSYADLKFAIGNPQKALKPEHIDRAKKLGSLAINVQWVTGDANKAEHSFFKINQQGTVIDPTELAMLKARSSPNALAARAIVRAGVGHKYWSKFSEDFQIEIEAEAKAVYDNLFRPQLQTPIKTTDIPIAGRAYSARTLPLIFDLVNLANGTIVGRVTQEVGKDIDGLQTVQFLKQVRRVAYRISGTHSSSLGLHPIVYFYGATGRFQPTSFFGVVALVKLLEKNNGFAEFTNVRRLFEDFLLGHKYLSNQITQKYGSGLKGYAKVVYLYEVLLTLLQAGLKDEKQIELAISLDKDLAFLRFFPEEEDDLGRKNFSTETKSATFLSEAVANLIHCKICNGYMHRNSISIDHLKDKRDGGIGITANAQLPHPYCNSTYKDILVKQSEPATL